MQYLSNLFFIKHGKTEGSATSTSKNFTPRAAPSRWVIAMLHGTRNIIFRGQQKFPHAPTGDMHVAQCTGVLTMKMAAPVKSSVSSRTCWYQANRREGHTIGVDSIEAASSRPHTLLPAHQPSCNFDAWQP